MNRLASMPGFLLLALGLLVVASACGGGPSPSRASTPGPAPTPSPAGPVSLPSLEAMIADKVMGDPAAPVTMIEYSSLTCPHCASFHQGTLPPIKASYIDPGKVKLVYRDYPLDEAALQAAMVARCSGDRFFAVVDRLFAVQSAWATSTDTAAALERAVASAGMSSAEVDACLATPGLRSGILAMQARGQSDYGVRATPTFIVGAQTIVGAYPFAYFDAILKTLVP